MQTLANFSKIVLLALSFFITVSSQSSTGTISGVVLDENGALIAGAVVTARNTATGFSRNSTTKFEGRYHFENIPTGTYEVTVDAPNFSRYFRSGVTLNSDQNVVVDAVLKAGRIEAVVAVNEDASLLDTLSAEVATRFDHRRLSELPITSNRNVLNILLSVPGVSQLSTGQFAYASGLSFSANGGRLRSNNFMVDGQDVNDPVFSGEQLALNNPDAIQEVNIVTNQFKAEYGRNSASVVNFVGKTGTNDYHGSLFWFHNNERLNACSNLDKVASGAPTGFCNRNAATDERRRAPRRRENQIGFTFGGPLTLPRFGEGGGPLVWKGTDRTFFFGDYQRWADRARVSGPTIAGAPSAAGRAVLQSVAAERPHVQALLDFVPAGVPNGRSATFTLNGVQYNVGLSNITGSVPFVFDDHQGSVRIDHRINGDHLLYGRYRFDTQRSSGIGQATPTGLTSINDTHSNAAVIVLNSVLTRKFSNEARIGSTRFTSSTDAEFPFSTTIPSVSITGLGLIGGNAGPQRTAIGYPLNLPAGRIVANYQLADALSYVSGSHSFKFGAELRRTDVRFRVLLNTRGNLVYVTPPGAGPVNITSFINDIAQSGTITLRMPGGDDTPGFYRWHEIFAFAQDEWRIRNDLTVTFGARYEYPGNLFGYLEDANERVLAANGNNPAFRWTPRPRTDTNNVAPRIGFSWNPRTSGKGILGAVTGGDKLVIRGGYSRAYDANFLNIPANIGREFPFVVNQTVLPASFAAIRNTTTPNLSQPNRLPRTTVDKNFRAPAADQISLELQRELSRDIVIRVGYIRTRGTGLIQTVDGNPCRPLPGLLCRPVGSNPNFGNRVNPDLETVVVYAHSAGSTYDGLQAGLTRRLSNNFSAGLHYTWSTFIDDASDVFSPSGSESSIAQDPFNRRGDRARSSYDRPHRLTGNFVYEFPFFDRRSGFAGRLLGGWQVNSFFTFQSGAPFTVTLGSDPACSVCGIGTTVRPNLNTNLNLSNMTIEEILAAGGAGLFTGLSPGQRVGNAGRNILRSDGIALVDLGFIKNTRITETVRMQFRADLFNALNSRNFGIPIGTNVSGLNFLNQWGTNGGNRRIVLGVRFVL